jgi:hypothetical protein
MDTDLDTTPAVKLDEDTAIVVLEVVHLNHRFSAGVTDHLITEYEFDN